MSIFIMQLTRSLNSHLMWKLLGFGLQLIITIFLSRMLEAADSGRFFYFVSWLTFFILIGSGGLDSAITYFLASGKMTKDQLLSVCLLWLVVVLIILAITGYLFADQIIFLNDFPENGLVYGILYIGGYLCIHFFTSFFYGEHQFLFPSKFLFYTTLIYVFLLTICSAYFSSASLHIFIVKSFIWMIGLQGLLLALLYLFRSGFSFDKIVFSKNTALRMMKYGFWVISANLLFFAVTRIDYWFLKIWKQPDTEIGNYIQVSRIAQLLQLLPSMLAAYFFPMTASKGDQMIPHLTRMSRFLIFINSMMIFPVALFGQYIFPFVFGNTYDQMHTIFLLYIPGMLALSVLAIMSTYFAGINMVRINMLISLMGLVIVCAGNWYLIPFYGTKAAAFVSSVAYVICCMIAVVLFLRKAALPLSDMLILQRKDLNLMKKVLAELINVRKY